MLAEVLVRPHHGSVRVHHRVPQEDDEGRAEGEEGEHGGVGDERRVHRLGRRGGWRLRRGGGGGGGGGRGGGAAAAKPYHPPRPPLAGDGGHRRGAHPGGGSAPAEAPRQAPRRRLPAPLLDARGGAAGAAPAVRLGARPKPARGRAAAAATADLRRARPRRGPGGGQAGVRHGAEAEEVRLRRLQGADHGDGQVLPLPHPLRPQPSALQGLRLYQQEWPTSSNYLRQTHP